MAHVYKITNTLTNKVYIGYTSCSIEDRWKQHKYSALNGSANTKFYNSIRKHGIDAWEVTLLVITESVTDAKLREIEYIELYDSYNNGYNGTKGGDGNNGIIMSEESNQKRSLALKGIPKNPKTVEKFRNRKNSAESNAKRSSAHKGMKKPWVKWSEEQIQKRALTRRSLTEEQYINIHRLRKEGKLIREIAELTGISEDIIKKWLKRSWDL